jgi:prevent-host-death family protein
MGVVNVQEADATLSALLSRVEQGEEVVIARDGTPIAKLVPVEPKPLRERGEWRKLHGWENFVYDRSIFAPMTDQELKEEGWE